MPARILRCASIEVAADRPSFRAPRKLLASTFHVLVSGMSLSSQAFAPLFPFIAGGALFV